MQIWIHDNKMKKIVALNNDIPDMLSYTNSSWHSYLDQATSTFDFTIPKFSNGELHEDLKFINDECFVSFYVNGSYQVFYIATLQEDDFNIQLTCNNTNLEYALEYVDPFNSDSAQTIEWYLNKMYFLSYAAVEIGNNEISDLKRTLTFDSQETKMNRLQSLMSKFEAEFEFKVELNRDGTYKRIVINIYQENHIGTDRKDVVLYYSNGLKGVQVNSDKTQMFTSGIFTGKDGLDLADVEISEKNSDGIEEFYSRKGDVYLRAPLAMQRYPSTMRVEGQDNWINKDFQTEYENVNDLKAYALRTLKKYAYPLVTYTASVQSGFVSHYTDLKLGDTIRIIDKNFVGGLALEARVSEMIISFDNPANNSFVFTNYRKLDNKASSALQTRIEQAVESKLPYRIELATTGGVTFKNNEGETIVKPSLYKGNLPYTKDVSWHWALGGVATIGTQYRIQAKDITDSEVLTVSAYVGNTEVATTEITLTNVDDGVGVESIDRHFTSSDKSDGVTIEGAEWSDKPPAPTEDGKYLWAYDEITYTDGTVTTTKPAAVGANFDVDAFRAEIAEDLKDVPNREEFENKIAEELATSKAEITTQIETAKTQAESNAKEYADTINQETAKVAELANAAAGEIKADLVNVKNNLTSTSIVANNAQAAVDAAKQELTEVANELSTAKQDLTNSVAEVNTKVNSTKEELTQAKQDLTSHAQQLQTQANAQTELSKRVTTVETTANGTKTTVNELTKTVAQNGKDITSVTNRTKTVEDDLANTKTTLTQVQTTANSASQKTATLETGLNGLSAKFDNFKIGGANLLLYSADPSKAPSGYYDSNGTQRTSETYNGSVVYKTQGIWNGIRVNLGNLVDRGLLKVGDVLTYSVAIRAEQKTPIQAILFIRYTNQSEADSPTNKTEAINLTADWQYVSVTFTVTAKMLAANTKVTYLGWELTSNAETDKYVYYACNKIERGNVATDYSPSDADIEQKVAEYKQTADQNYASLQSNLQTLDGTVKQNKSEFDQTASQIKSSISAVEGKIPTSVGGRNLAQKTSKDWSKPFTNFKGTENTCPDLYKVLVDGLSVGDTLKSRIVLKYTDIIPASGKTARIRMQGSGNVTNWGSGGYNISTWKTISGSGEVVIEHEFKITANHLKNDYWNLGFRTDYIASGSLQWKLAKVEKGTLFTDWSPAPEDTASQISSLSSELKQTADGMTLLATKTELNSAKNELQSGINTATNKANSNAQTISTHTTQISALNTGLQAKVSQTDFNTLSGRVTTAENNITAKANELSSKITSVEGKIPTTVGGRNYALKTGDSKSSSTAGDKLYDLSSGFDGIADNATLIIEFDWRVTAPTSTSKFRINRVITYSDGTAEQWNDTIVADGVYTDVSSSSGSGHYSGTFTKVPYNGKTVSERYLYLNQTTANGTITISNLRIRVGSLKSDWQPAPEDTATQISSLSSQIKQTADGITLLATKTELNTAKNELQSGINTATNKANSNAQTISTHTTQISALNTGLNAKVSQTDFNTLSGRVTTAENNITAKANELSSKITSVEGKIPTGIGAVNLFKGSRDFSGSNWIGGAGVYVEDYKGVKIFKKQDIWGGRSQYFEVKTGEEYVFSAYVKSSAETDRVAFYLVNDSKQPKASGLVSFGSDNGQDNVNIGLTDKYKRIAIKIKITKDGWMAPRIERYNSDAYLFFGGYKLERGNVATDWSPALEDYDSKLATAQSEIKQTTDSIKASVQTLDNNTVKNSSLTINSDGIVMKAGKSTTDVANAIGSYFAVNQNAINLFSDKINVKGNMIVSGAITSDKIASKQINTSHLNGKIITADVISSNAVTAGAIKAGAVTTEKMSANSINGDRIAAGTLDAAKIKAGSITASQIASGTLTSGQIKAGAIKSINIEASAITSDKIAANSISSDKIVSSGITANVIQGGVLKALNNAMQINLDDSNITFGQDASVIFTSSDNALKRVIPDKPSQFIKMFDEVFVSEIGELPNSTLTVIGSNSDRTESSDSSGFGGVRIWNGRSSTNTTSFVELVGNRVAIYGNKNRSPWLFDMTTTTSSLIPQNSNGIKHTLGRSDRRIHEVHANNMYIQGERVAMMLKDLALHIGYGGNNGWVGRIQ